MPFSACLSLFILGISAHTHIVVNGIAAWSSVQPMHACNKASLLIMLGLKHHRIHLPMFMLVLKYCRIQYIYYQCSCWCSNIVTYIYQLPALCNEAGPHIMLVLKHYRTQMPPRGIYTLPYHLSH